jgi:excisionase family DNA binding protein
MKPVLDIKAAANYLNVSVPTVRRMAKRGEIGKKIGGKLWRFKTTELEQFASGVIVSDASKTSEANSAQGGAVQAGNS